MFNPATVTLAREARSLTQGDLASRIGLTQGNLSKIEKGALNINNDILLRISEVLDFPASFFSQSALFMRSNFYYRKKYLVQGKQLKELKARIAIITHAIGCLLSEVSMETTYQKFQFDLSESWDEERASKTVRSYLGLPLGPIIEPIKAIERTGIIVYEMNDDDIGFDGFTTYTENGHPIVFLNKHLSADRKRFTLAHEVGHICMHLPFVLEDYRDEEKEANRFASAFLMPAEDMGNDLVGLTYYMLPSLKEYWRVSKAAIIRRAHDLKYITKERYNYLNVELGRQKERKVENGSVEIESPGLLRRILNILTDSGASVDYLAALSHLSVSEFEETFYPERNPIKIRISVKSLRPNVDLQSKLPL